MKEVKLVCAQKEWMPGDGVAGVAEAQGALGRIWKPLRCGLDVEAMWRSRT